MAAPPHGGSFRVLHTARVVPSSPGGGPALRERAVPLTFLDVMWLHSPPVERVFLYRLGVADDDVDALLSRLADSLSRVLHVFFRLAGRLRLTPGKTNRYELFCKPGDGVAFTVAEYDGDGVDELAKDDPREVAKIAPLVPKLPEGGGLLALQNTVLLPERSGIALGVTVHHAACDGSSSTHFLHTWAAICAGDALLPKPPVIDRTSIREREDIYDLMTTQLDDRLKEFYSPDVVGDKHLATFTLSRDNLQSVKDRVAGVAARRGVPPPRCTSIVATFAVTWHCHIRAAQGEDLEPRNEGRAHLVFLTDHRTRMEPRVPDKHLGNCVGPCFTSAPKKVIAATGTDGLFTTCSVIAAAIDEAMRYEPDYWDRCRERGGELMLITIGGPPLSVAGSPRFRVYDVDFGFGRPAKVEVVSAAKTCAMAVAEGRDGSGGIEVGIALPPEQMERFRRCFNDAMAWLSSSSSDK